MARQKVADVLAGLSLMTAFVLASAIDPAHAETGAPIVFKTVGVSQASRPVAAPTGGVSLSIASHARVPSFSTAQENPSAHNAFSAGSRFGVSAAIPQTSPALQRLGADIGAGPAAPYAGPAYQVDGRWYVPAHEPNYDETGIASWYGPSFHGKASASGEPFDENALTAAHPTLPIPSLVRVTNLENGRSLVVRLNDRGPFVDDRIIDLSRAAAGVLDMHGPGTARVRVQYVGPAPAEPNTVPANGAVSAEPASRNILSRPLEPAMTAPPSAQLAPVQPVGLSAGQFFLQAGSFADLGNANALREKLRPVGATSIKAVQVNGMEYYRVMLGPWPTREEAEEVRDELGVSGYPSLTVANVP